jgi:hypothetical protein
VDRLVSIDELEQDSGTSGSLGNPSAQLPQSIEPSTWSEDSSSASSVDQSPVHTTESYVTSSPWVMSPSWPGDPPTMQHKSMSQSVSYECLNDPGPMLINQQMQGEQRNPPILYQHAAEPPRRVCTWDSSQYYNAMAVVGWPMESQMSHRSSFQADLIMDKTPGWRDQGIRVVIPKEANNNAMKRNSLPILPVYMSQGPASQPQAVTPQVLNAPSHGAGVSHPGPTGMNKLTGPMSNDSTVYTEPFEGITQMFEDGVGGRGEWFSQLSSVHHFPFLKPIHLGLQQMTSIASVYSSLAQGLSH